MSTRIEFHVLQSFAPSNLNRDDTGSPKDGVFGGVRRGRISSQALKRAARLHMRDGGLIPAHAGSTRTKRLVHLIEKRLEGRVDPAVAQGAAVNVLAKVGSQKKIQAKPAKGGSEPLTEYLLFVGESELEEIVEVIAAQAEELSNPKSKALDAAGLAVTEILKRKGSGSVDVALYGRMLANLPEGNADAACQVAHAISTHRVDREFDYFTAVDDENPADSSGAGMIGTVEFNSSVYYRYSVVDVDQLRANLADDKVLTANAVSAYARSVVESAPSGKQNTFAAHNPPSVVLVTVRRHGGPANLANAFEKPVSQAGGGLVEASATALREYWHKLDGAYGKADDAWVLDLTGTFDSDKGVTRVASLDELVAAVRAASM